MGNKQYPDQLDNPPESPGYLPPEPHYPPPPGYNNTPANNQYGIGPGTPPPYRDYGPPPYRSPYLREGQVAGFWTRFVATLIDCVLVSIPSGILSSLLFWTTFHWTFDDNWGGYFGPGGGTSIIIWGIYAWLCYTYLNGNTIGKRVMGIKLVNPDGTKPSLPIFVLHYTIGYLVNGVVIGLGFLWVIFDPYCQTWGQKIFKDSTVFGRW